MFSVEMKIQSKIWVFIFFLYLSVANGEPPIGIPWETFQKKKIYA